MTMVLMPPILLVLLYEIDWQQNFCYDCLRFEAAVTVRVEMVGQPTRLSLSLSLSRLKIIFKVRTFEVGPPDFPNATPVSLPFSLPLLLLLPRDER